MNRTLWVGFRSLATYCKPELILTVLISRLCAKFSLGFICLSELSIATSYLRNATGFLQFDVSTH